MPGRTTVLYGSLWAVPLMFAQAAEVTVLVGVPEIKSECDQSGCRHHQLSAQEASAAAVELSRVGDRIRWTSRENQDLLEVTSGAYRLFIDPQGGGYIKVEVLPSGLAYIEHITLGLDTITYRGAVREFAQEKPADDSPVQDSRADQWYRRGDEIGRIVGAAYLCGVTEAEGEQRMSNARGWAIDNEATLEDLESFSIGVMDGFYNGNTEGYDGTCKDALRRLRSHEALKQ